MAKKNQKEKKKFSLFTKGSPDYFILITVMILVAFGLVMVLSASSPSALAESNGKSSYGYISKQAFSAVIGLVAMLALSKIDYHIYRKLKWLIYIVCIVFLVLVGFIGTGANRSQTLDYYCRN